MILVCVTTVPGRRLTLSAEMHAFLVEDHLGHGLADAVARRTAAQQVGQVRVHALHVVDFPDRDPCHARRTASISMALPPLSERLVWHCGEHTAKPASAACRRPFVTKVCCFLWHAKEERQRGSFVSVAFGGWRGVVALRYRLLAGHNIQNPATCSSMRLAHSVCTKNTVLPPARTKTPEHAHKHQLLGSIVQDTLFGWSQFSPYRFQTYALKKLKMSSQ